MPITAGLAQVYWILAPFCIAKYWQAKAMLPGCKAHSEGHGHSGSSREGPEVTSIRASPAFPERDPTPTSRTGPGSVWGCPDCQCVCWAEAYVLANLGSPVIFHLMEHLPCATQLSEQCPKQILILCKMKSLFQLYILQSHVLVLI